MLLLTAAVTPEPRAVLVVGGQTHGLLEPCGCGGQDAGGLARRAAMVASLRAREPDLAVLDLGGGGRPVERWPVILRCLGRLGVEACGLDGEELAAYDRWTAAAQPAAVAPLSLQPTRSGPPPRRSLVIERGGLRIGVMVVAHGGLGLPELLAAVEAEQAALRECDLWLLLSHLGGSTTQQLVGRLAPAARPRMVCVGTTLDLTAPAIERDGVCWVPVSDKGRSLSVLAITRDGAGWRVAVDQQLVAEGERDAVVQGWVDEQLRRERLGEAAAGPAAPAASLDRCAECHAAAVARWREHPHAAAATTLEQRERDVAACLRCHDQGFRETGRRPAPDGDRGVTCAACHSHLTAHAAQPERLPTSPDAAVCAGCHTPENSPRYDPAAYRAAVRAVCRPAG